MIEPQSTALFSALKPQPIDGLLSLIGLYRADPRDNKLDLGVGVYRDEAGNTPVLRTVKQAEAVLVETQTSKSYLGPEGDLEFVARLAPIIFGSAAVPAYEGAQTPGGTGALRLAMDLIGAARPGARVLVGTPTWANHQPILDAARLETVTYAYFDTARQAVRFDEMMSALQKAEAGDAVLLQACCHNPTGADLDQDQWSAVAEVVAARGLTPVIDLAYQGLGGGLEKDAIGMRRVLQAAPDALVAYSCDKNFGLYRERVGALYAVSQDADRLALAGANIKALARANWSMPPDHGAAVVRTILSSPQLASDWRGELETMRQRILGIRTALAAALPELSSLKTQHGMFATLPLDPRQVATLREDHAVYMAGSGRINLAGLNLAALPAFAAAYRTCRQAAFA